SGGAAGKIIDRHALASSRLVFGIGVRLDELREIPVQHGWSRNDDGSIGGIRCIRGVLIGAKEKQLVFQNRTANSASDLLPPLRSFRGRKVPAGSELIIAIVIERVAMKLIRSGFCN